MICPSLSDLPPSPKTKIGWPWTVESELLPKIMPQGLPWPKISIVTPSFNQGQFFEETIRSILLQKYPNLEYIIMDGGSSDESVAIIRQYEPWLSYWVSQPDNGQAEAINRGWQISQGQILCWLNSDDILLPNALATIAQTFATHSDIQIVIGLCNIINSEGQKIAQRVPKDFNLKTFLTGSSGLGQPAVFFSKDLVKKVGFLNDHLHYVFDWEYFIRIAQQYPTQKIYYLPKSLACFRHWQEAKSHQKRVDFFIERRQVLDQLFADSQMSQSLQVLRNKAYGYTYYEQAEAHAAIGEKQKMLQAFVSAFMENPFPLRIRRVIRLFQKLCCN